MNEENSSTTYTLTVASGKAGQRLDKFLADQLPEYSRTRLKNLIEDGCVHRDNGDQVQPMSDPAIKIHEGQVFTIEVPAPVAATPRAQSIPLDVVYEDADVIVIDKPAGLVVHPAPGSPDGTLVNALLGYAAEADDGAGLSGIGGVERPGIVHRLDKGTSGLMVVAKNDRTHRSLSEQFAERTIERAYYALVWGVPNPSQGEITGNIGRSPTNRKKMAVVKRGGKFALTHFKTLRTFGAVAALVECRLATGRTHQIRVHMASIGHPLIGDPVYGGGWKSRKRALAEDQRQVFENLDHQALHAYLLGFRVGIDERSLVFEGEKPQYFKELIEILSGI